MAKKKGDMVDMYCNYCMSWKGVLHVLSGVGLGFLAVHYLGLVDVLTWGWVLVGAGVLAHLFLKMK